VKIAFIGAIANNIETVVIVNITTKVNAKTFSTAPGPMVITLNNLQLTKSH